MRVIKIIFCLFIITLLAIPLAFFNFKTDSVSEIDNRKLTEFNLRKF